MKTSSVVLLSALAAQSVSAGWFDQQVKSVVRNTPQQCTPHELKGLDWSDLKAGKAVTKSKKYKLQGFTCRESPLKSSIEKRNIGKRYLNNCITSDIQVGKFTNEISSTKQFTITYIYASAEKDVDVEFQYNMPDGSTCKQIQSISSSGTKIENTQCGGAISFKTRIYKQSTTTIDKCSFNIHQINFNCGTQTGNIFPASANPGLTAIAADDDQSDNSVTPVSSSSIPPSSASSELIPASSIPSDSGSIPLSAVPSNSIPSNPASGSTSSDSVPLGSVPSDSVSSSSTSSSSTSPDTTSSTSPDTTSSSSISPDTTSSSSISSGSASPDTDASNSTSPSPASSSAVTSSSASSSTSEGSVPTPSNKPTDESKNSSADNSEPKDETTQKNSNKKRTEHKNETNEEADEKYVNETDNKNNEKSDQPAEDAYQNSPVSASSMPVLSAYQSNLIPTPSIPSPAPYQSNVVTPISSVAPLYSAPVYSAVPSVSISVITVTTTTCPNPTATAPSLPVKPIAYPDILPQCMQTYLKLTQCVNNGDVNCLCPNSEFTKQVTNCITAWGENNDIPKAIEFLQGLCASYISEHPNIVNDVPRYITLPPIPGLVTTVSVSSAMLVQNTDVPYRSVSRVQSYVTKYVMTAVTVPAIKMVPSGVSNAVIVPVTAAVPALNYPGYLANPYPTGIGRPFNATLFNTTNLMPPPSIGAADNLTPVRFVTILIAGLISFVLFL